MMMPPPSYPAAPAPMAFGAPAFQPPPAPAPAPARPPAPIARTATPAGPKPIIRLQAPEETGTVRPAPVTIPSPEQLGVGLSRPAAVATDWAATRSRLKELGAVGFQLDQVPGGECRFVCWLPRPAGGAAERIESRAPTEAAAVRLGLERAARWKTQQR
jgi:hypothetical protein